MSESTPSRSIFPLMETDWQEKLYFEMIDAALKEEEEQTVSNGKPAHAAYIIYRFFQTAEKDIRIYTGSLSREFKGVVTYSDPNIIQAAVKFLRKPGTNLSIVVANDVDVDPGESTVAHPLIKSVLEAETKGNFSVHKERDDPMVSFDKHFIVKDNTALRVETDAEEAKAFVVFKNSEFAASLARLFDVFKHNGEDLLSPLNP